MFRIADGGAGRGDILATNQSQRAFWQFVWPHIYLDRQYYYNSIDIITMVRYYKRGGAELKKFRGKDSRVFCTRYPNSRADLDSPRAPDLAARGLPAALKCVARYSIRRLLSENAYGCTSRATGVNVRAATVISLLVTDMISIGICSPNTSTHGALPAFTPKQQHSIRMP